MTVLNHRHSWEVTSTEDAPDGLNGRKVHLACSHPDCTMARSTITLKTDKELQHELDAYNAVAQDGDTDDGDQ